MSKKKTYLDDLKDAAHHGKDVMISAGDMTTRITADGWKTDSVPDIGTIHISWVQGVMWIDTKDGNMETLNSLELFPVSKQHMVALRDYLNYCLLDFKDENA